MHVGHRTIEDPSIYLSSVLYNTIEEVLGDGGPTYIAFWAWVDDQYDALVQFLGCSHMSDGFHYSPGRITITWEVEHERYLERYGLSRSIFNYALTLLLHYLTLCEGLDHVERKPCGDEHDHKIWTNEFGVVLTRFYAHKASDNFESFLDTMKSMVNIQRFQDLSHVCVD